MSGGDLVSNQVLAADDIEDEVVDLDRHPSLPRLIEVDTVDRGDEVDSVWRVSKLDDRVLTVEVGLGDVEGENPKSARALWIRRAFDASIQTRIDLVK